MKFFKIKGLNCFSDIGFDLTLSFHLFITQ